MCPETVIPSSDAKPSDKIPKNGENQGLSPERGKTRANEANNGGSAEDAHMEPVELLAPVRPLKGRAWLLGLQVMLDVVVGDVEVFGDVLNAGGVLLRWRNDGGHFGRRR
jgi:hypothetical protein